MVNGNSHWGNKSKSRLFNSFKSPEYGYNLRVHADNLDVFAIRFYAHKMRRGFVKFNSNFRDWGICDHKSNINDASLFIYKTSNAQRKRIGGCTMDDSKYSSHPKSILNSGAKNTL